MIVLERTAATNASTKPAKVECNSTGAVLHPHYTKYLRVGAAEYIGSNFDIILAMKGHKRKRRETTIFESIRKPTAPPSRTFGEAKPEERARPSGRKVKHKKKVGETEE
jgi:hypothetical protein